MKVYSLDSDYVVFMVTQFDKHVPFSLQTRARDLRLTEEARRRLAGKFTFTLCRLLLGTLLLQAGVPPLV